MTIRCKTCQYRRKFRTRNICDLRIMKHIEADGSMRNINFTIKDIESLFCDSWKLSSFYKLDEEI